MWITYNENERISEANSYSAVHLYFFVANGLCFLSIHEGCPLHTQELRPALSDMEPYRDLEDQPPKTGSDDYVRLP